MVLRPAQQDGSHTRHHYQGLGPVARQVTDSRGEPTIILLNEYSIKVIPDDLLLYL